MRQRHSVEETAQLFQISPATLYRWRQRPSLARTGVNQRRQKLDPETLRQHVRDNPTARLKDKDQAKVFGVHPSAIGHALQWLHITVKKTSSATASATIGNDKSS